MSYLRARTKASFSNHFLQSVLRNSKINTVEPLFYESASICVPSEQIFSLPFAF